jgi:hypothetical protein
VKAAAWLPRVATGPGVGASRAHLRRLPTHRAPAYRQAVADPVLADLADQLRYARAEGASFPAAWPEATRAALAAASKYDRVVWPSVFADTQDAWRCAYQHAPPPPSASAVAHLAGVLVDQPDTLPTGDRLVA